MGSPEADYFFYVNEIFVSLQGEGTRSGRLCLFIRMQGCNLRCEWCDTKYAVGFKSEESRAYKKDELLEIIKKENVDFIEFTGGEPAMCKGLPELCLELVNAGYEVALETNGSIPLHEYDKRVIKIVDFKAPDSGMSDFNDFDIVGSLTKNDEVKFVVASDYDYMWTKKIIKKYKLAEIVNAVLISPVFGKIGLQELAEKMIADRLDARFNLQIHKYIWEPDKRGV